MTKPSLHGDCAFPFVRFTGRELFLVGSLTSRSLSGEISLDLWCDPCLSQGCGSPSACGSRKQQHQNLKYSPFVIVTWCSVACFLLPRLSLPSLSPSFAMRKKEWPKERVAVAGLDDVRLGSETEPLSHRRVSRDTIPLLLRGGSRRLSPEGRRGLGANTSAVVRLCTLCAGNC